jgi:predicted DNA-binding ribbon-helix-helix protein
MSDTRRPPEGKMKTTLYLDKALWTRLRIRALEEGLTATALLEQLIADYLTAKRAGPKAGRKA